MTPRRFKLVTYESVLGVLLAAFLGVSAALDPTFVSPGVQLELSTHAVELMLLALPMTLVIISGGIDLSVGSTMALAAVALGLLYEAGAPVWLGCAAAVAVGTAAGAINGFFVSRLRVHPLVVTLATLAAYRGLAEGISHGRPISGFPEGFLRWVGGAVGVVPVAGIACAVAAIAFALALKGTVPGFWVYAVGGNERAARYGVVPVERVKFALYTISGAVAGLAGVLFVARRNTAKADVGTGIELDVIAGVVLGGTSIFGGRGSIVGTVLGVAFIHEIRELVSWHWQRDELILIVVGTILIGSILLNNLASRRRA